MYSYAGQHEDELAFNVGDIITLISKEEEAWWKGELDGNQGVFPSNYVEEINCKYIFKYIYSYTRKSLRREIGCILIIQQKFRKFEFFLLCSVEKFKFSEFLLDDKNATSLYS